MAITQPWRFVPAQGMFPRLLSYVAFAACMVSLSFARVEGAEPKLSAPHQLANSARLQSYFTAEVKRQSESSRASIEAVTAETWPTVSEQWRAELREMLGLEPLPERTDLSVRVTGSVDVEGARIEKLHYQSRPGLYVCANLYLPTDPVPDKGWPAVLYVCGHARVAEQGRLLGNKTGYHHHGLWFARHGVACLIIDTIQLGEFMGEHHGTYRFGRWDWVSRGYTPAGVETWNAMRAVDLLQSRKEIDPERIGITGRSGGGAYSWYTAAIDTRIKVAVPVAGITDLEDHVIDGCVSGHCDCMYMVNYYGWDYPKLAALVAPRALLLANSDNDTIFPLDGILRTHAQLVPLYKKLNAFDAFRLLVTPGPHLDTQELQVGAFHWLLDHLKGGSTVVDLPASKSIEPQELAVFPHELPLDEHVTDVGAWFVKSAIDADQTKRSLAEWREYLSPTLLKRLKLQWPSLNADQAKLVELGSGTRDDFQWKRMRIDSQSPWQIELLRVTLPSSAAPQNSSLKKQNLVIADEVTWQAAQGWTDGKSSANDSKNSQWTQWFSPFKGETITLVALRGVGPNAWNAEGRDLTQVLRRFYLLGQSVESGQLFDLLQTMRVLAATNEGKVAWTLAGEGRSGMLGVLAALMDEKVVGLCVSHPVTDPLLAPSIPGMLRECSWQQLLSTVQENLEYRVLKLEPSLTDRYLDPDVAPLQGTGIRIVEVSQKSAKVWGRTTRWPAANLADQSLLQFAEPAKKGTQNRKPILPETGVDGLRFAVPGAAGELRVRYHTGRDSWRETAWIKTRADQDYAEAFLLEGLRADQEYEIRVEARRSEDTAVTSTTNGRFKTLPENDQPKSLRIAITTCQEFEDRDGGFGFDLYRTMLRRNTQSLIHAGDVVYYDKLARSKPLANYHWQRVYSLPSVVEFHRQVPAYFLKDDHDTYVNDTWPGQKLPWTESFSFEAGQEIFRQQTGLPQPAYRTFRFGRDLQVWLMEGRDYRSPNNLPDDEEKSIWGGAQWAWLQSTLKESDAKYRLIVSPTPIVGPDRDNKHDNHANDAFAKEGERVRKFLSTLPNTFVVCGDRHWQYHSIDPKSGLHEYSVGPASDRHAGGWDAKDYRSEIHRYLRVGGGYLEVEVDAQKDRSRLSIRHLDTLGNLGHEVNYE